jgi:hypothetical protein
MAELKQTKGFANFKGIIGGLDAIKKGKAKEFQYRDDEKLKKMQFSIKTSDDNMHYVQLIQFKMGKSRDSVWISRKDDETGNFETQEIPWEKRNDPLTDGWRIIGVSIKATGDENAKSMVAEDAIEYIKDNFNDGDTVFIGADLSHSDWKDSVYHNYDIKRMYIAKEDIDFEDEEFEETADFNEQIIFDSIAVVEGEGFLKGYTVDYKKDKTEVQYVVRDKDVLNYFKETAKFGDLVTVEGIVNNRVVYKYRDAKEDEESDGVLVGRQTKSSKRNSQIREVEYEDKTLEIIGVSKNVEGAYDEKDLEIVDIGDSSDIPF